MNFDALIMKQIGGKAPCVVGLDVGFDEIPDDFVTGNPPKSVQRFNRAVIDAVYDRVSAIAVNVPMLLPYGLETVADAVSYAKEKGLYTIVDAKCIGEPRASRVEAELYFGNMDADCVTVSPYYGAAGLAPFLERCALDNKNIFVLSHTDTGSPQDFQELMAGLRMVYRAVCEKIAIWGEKRIGDMGYSDIGIMIGGIANSALREMRYNHKHTLFLLTGYNGDKVSAHDLNGAFDMKGLGGLVYVTRNITLPGGEGDFSERVKNAADEVCRDLRLCF